MSLAADDRAASATFAADNDIFMRPRTGIALITALLLTACGGGGGNADYSPPPAPQPTSQDLANAKAAALTGTYEPSDHMLTLSWTDTFASGTPYRVELKQADGTWSPTDSVPASGSKSVITWHRSVATTIQLRIEAVLSGYTVVLQTAGGQQEVDVNPPTQHRPII